MDYGMGNLGSVKNMLRKLGVAATISSSPGEIAGAGKLILPGVGAFDHGMQNLESRALISALTEKVVTEKTPTLGICLGMQLMGERSEEGARAGLGWVKAHCLRFRFEAPLSPLSVPHMGWNTISLQRANVLFHGLEEARFYFAHSYHVVCRDPDDVVSNTRYGVDFTSSFRSGNIYGVQFHPEKSHKFGMKLLENFVRLAE